MAITELDIRMTLPSTATLNSQQSVDYQNSVAACVAVENCVGVNVWDFSDKVRVHDDRATGILLTYLSSILGFPQHFQVPGLHVLSTRISLGKKLTLGLLLGFLAILPTRRELHKLRRSFSH